MFTFLIDIIIPCHGDWNAVTWYGTCSGRVGNDLDGWKKDSRLKRGGGAVSNQQVAVGDRGTTPHRDFLMTTTRVPTSANLEPNRTSLGRLFIYILRQRSVTVTGSTLLGSHQRDFASTYVMRSNSSKTPSAASSPQPNTRSNINSLLPPELLALVFSFVILDAREEISFEFPGKPDAEQLRRQFSQSPLLNASLVCRAWYTVIKDTARFWTFVGIDLKRSSATASKGSKTVPSPLSITQSKKAEILLEKSGRLPLSVAICPDHIEDIESIDQAIRKHVERLETLYLIPSDKKVSIKSGRSRSHQTPPSQAFKLFLQPLPNLKRLSVDKCLAPVFYGIASRPLTIRQAVDAPRLESIFCHTHLITPKSPVRLASLSLASVQLNHSQQPSVEFPHLVNLRIQDCNPGAILSTFSTPSLKRLIVRNWNLYDAPAQLPCYDSLHELQWFDMGQDPVFVMLCQLCPNLKRYSSYIEGDEESAVPGKDDPPQSVLGVVDDEMARGVDTSPMWPMLEEVLLDRASCDEVATLLTAVPSIKRVRVLYPVEWDDEDDQEQEMEKLAMLRQKVDVAIMRESWNDGEEKADPVGKLPAQAPLRGRASIISQPLGV